MKFKTPKFKRSRLGINQFAYKKIKLTALFIISLTIVKLNGQTMEYQGFGKYEFDTEFPDHDLHFYLFDDGYHSFEKNSVHTYLNTSLPAIPTLYHKGPYLPGDPDPTSFLGVTQGTLFAGPPTQELANQIEVKSSWNLVNQNENFFLLMFENTNGPGNKSGCVEFHFDKEDIQIVDDKILDDYGNGWVEARSFEDSEYGDYTHKFKWEFYDLKPGEQRFVYIPATCLKGAFSTIDTRGVLKVDNCEEYIPENSKLDGSNEDVYDSKMYSLKSIVSNFPHDPNLITTDPPCIELAAGTVKFVTYRVVFQNDGLDPAQNVYINMEFDGEIGFENIQLTNSSAYCELIYHFDKVEVTFPEIYLPGMGQTPPPSAYEETIGWVEFVACFKNYNATNGDPDCINTEGEITFDNEPPLPIDNSLCTAISCGGTSNALGDCPRNFNFQTSDGINLKVVAVNENPEDFDFIISSTISTNEISVEGLDNYSKLKCSILSTSGDLLKNIDLNTNKTIDISTLPQGLYIIRIFDDIHLQTKQFVKI